MHTHTRVQTNLDEKRLTAHRGLRSAAAAAAGMGLAVQLRSTWGSGGDKQSDPSIRL